MQDTSTIPIRQPSLYSVLTPGPGSALVIADSVSPSSEKLTFSLNNRIVAIFHTWIGFQEVAVSETAAGRQVSPISA